MSKQMKRYDVSFIVSATESHKVAVSAANKLEASFKVLVSYPEYRGCTILEIEEEPDCCEENRLALMDAAQEG